MKRRLLMLLALSMVVNIFSGCANQTKPQEKDMEQWLQNANLSAHETKEELYQKALQEHGLVIYTNTSRISDVKRSFEKEYPGLVVELSDMRSNTIPPAVLHNYDNREYAIDLVVCPDTDGVISNELLDKGILYTYVPYDIRKHLRADHCQDDLMFLGEAVMLFYNTRSNSSSPVRNWWQLTEAAFHGRVFLPNPLSSTSTYSFFELIVKNADQMASSYQEYYGQKLVLPEDTNAGEYFLERLIQNAALLNSSDEVLEAVSSSGGENDAVGIMISSKIRKTAIGYDVGIAYNLSPFDGVYTPSSIFIAGGSPNVNTAKLFIRWLLGEEDGTGEGAAPYLTDGTWSPRTDIQSAAEYGLDQLNLWQTDKDYCYTHLETFRQYWLELLERYK
ncbi:hypothetical protein V6615_12145 [Oscillospiraceae bacterium PP1C4]